MIKKLFIFFILLIVFTSLVNAQSDRLKLVEEFVSPEEIMLYEIESADVFENNFLFLGLFGNKAVHFDGEVWKELNAETCHPGINFLPISAKFDHLNGDIFASSAGGIWGFRFNKNGECLGAAHKDFLAPTSFTSNGGIYGLTLDFTQTNILKWDLEGKFSDTVYSYKNEYPESSYRFMGGGIVNSEEVLYFLNSVENSIHKFESETNNLSQRELESKYLNHAKNDIEGEINSPKFMRSVGEFFKKYSINMNLYDFNDEYLLLHSSGSIKDEKGYYVYFISKYSLEIENEFELEGRLILAKSNKLYFAEDLDTELPQVKISVFELK